MNDRQPAADASPDPMSSPDTARRPRPRRERRLAGIGLAAGAVLAAALLGLATRSPALLAGATSGPTVLVAPSTGAVTAAASEPAATPATEGTDGPTIRPASTPTSVPTVKPPAPSPTQDVGYAPVQLPLGLRARAVTDGLRIRTRPNLDDDTRIALLDLGTKFTLVDGPVPAAGYWWYRVNDVAVALPGGATGGWVASASRKGTPWIGPTPRSCEDWSFAEADITVRSFAELESGFVGTWMGCVTTPWVPPQWVTLTFRSDGTYASAVLPHPKADGRSAFYYGVDGDSPARRYWLTDLQASLYGIGEIDIVFDEASGSAVRDQLRNIRLMGDRLDFELFHDAIYGPVSFQLYRIVTE